MAKPVELKSKLRERTGAAVGGFAPAPRPGVPETPPDFGNTPMAPGTVYKVSKPTETEAAVLTQLGWKPGDPVPGDLADKLDLIESVRKQSFENIPPPVAPDTPALKIPVAQEFNQLPGDKQAELRAALAQAKDFQAAAEAEQPQYSETVADIVQNLKVVDDTKDATYAGVGVNKTGTDKGGPRVAPNEDEKLENTGATARHTNCPHCGWNQTMPAVAEPTLVDKRSFLQSILGDIPFQKTYVKYGGNITIGVRSLRLSEIHACHQQAHRDMKEGKVPDGSYYDQVMGYRVALQFIELNDNKGAAQNMPEDMESWVASLTMAGIKPEKDDLPVKAISEWVYGNVITTESMVRNVSNTVYEFNRLVARLEANSDNESFWLATLEDR